VRHPRAGMRSSAGDGRSSSMVMGYGSLTLGGGIDQTCRGLRLGCRSCRQQQQRGSEARFSRMSSSTLCFDWPPGPHPGIQPWRFFWEHAVLAAARVRQRVLAIRELWIALRKTV